MEPKRIKILLIGSFSDISVKMLKVIYPCFEIDKINPTNCSDDYIINFINDRFQPHIILININQYSKNRYFYDEFLVKKFSKVCFRIVSMPELWEEDTERVRGLMKDYMEEILKELERKNK